MADSPVVLETSGVTVQFGGVLALREVSMSVHRGEVCGLIGPNGREDDLFDVLSGVRPPKSGRVLLHGEDVTSRSPTWRARHGVRRTFQRQQIFGGLTVEDNVLTALEWHGGGGGLVADLVASPRRRTLERSDGRALARCSSTCASTRSATPTRRRSRSAPARELEIARAIVDEPTVLLLDEPTSGLDEPERDRLGGIIQAEHERGTAVVLVEHDVEFVMAQCDRIVVLNLGEVIADGTPAEVRKDERVVAAYLS